MHNPFKAIAFIEDNSDSRPDAKKVFPFQKVIALVTIAFIVVFGLFVRWYILRGEELETQQAEAAILSQTVALNNIKEFSIYKGKGAGLYEGISNEPQFDIKIEIQKQLELIKPILPSGQGDKDGKIGFVFIGDPHTEGEFKSLDEVRKSRSGSSNSLVLVDGAQKDQDTTYWKRSLYPWEILGQRVISQGLSAGQVQVIWINLSFDEYKNEIDADVKAQADTLNTIIKTALSKYPNTKVVYLSSPRYAGYSTMAGYQEPESFEAGLAVRELLSRHDKDELNYKDDIRLLTSEPALVWGPYVWNNNINSTGDFAYPADKFESDGITLSTIGKQKYAIDLISFWSSYEYSSTWFTL